MEIEIRHYRLASELSGLINEFIQEHGLVNPGMADSGEQLRFIVPSSRDRSWWRRRANLDQNPPCNSTSYANFAIPWIWQDLYEDICATQNIRPRRLIAPPERLLILKQLLDDSLTQKKKSNKDLLNQWPGLQRASFLSDLSRDIQELFNEAVRPEQLIANNSQDVSNTEQGHNIQDTLTPPSEWLLPEVYSEYLNYLKKNDLLDSAQIWTVARERLVDKDDKVDFSGDGPWQDVTGNMTGPTGQGWGRNLTLVFIGFMSFTHGQKELLDTLSLICKKIVFLKPESFLSGYNDLDEQFPRAGLSMVSMTGAGNAFGHMLELPVSEPALEPETIARELALWYNAKGQLAEFNFPGFENIGIMLPSNNSNLDAMTAALERYGVPFTLENGQSVADTLPGRVLAIIRRLKNLDFPTRTTALLMTQPCFAGTSFSVEKAIWANRTGLENWESYLVDAIEKNAEKSISKQIKEKNADTLNTALLAIQAIKTFCDRLKQGGKPAEIMTAFYDFLTAKGLWLDRVSNLPLSIPELDENIRVLSLAINGVKKKALALRELMPDIGPIGEVTLKGENGDEAFEFLTTWCRETSILPPLPHSGAVHLYIGTPPVLASWPVWIMLDVTQKRWQSPIAGSPLLDDTTRERLRLNNAILPDVKEKAKQREALFRRLLQTGESLTVISRSRMDEKGRPIIETSFVQDFLKDIQEHFKNRGGESPLSLSSSSSDSLKSASINFLVGESEFRFPDVDPDPKFEPERHAPSVIDKASNYLPVSDLHRLLGCPFQWWLGKRAGLRLRDTGLFQPWQQGNIVHTIFQETWRRLRDEYNLCSASFDVANFNTVLNNEWEQLETANGPYEQYKRIITEQRFARRLGLIKYRVMRMGKLQADVLGVIRDTGWHHERVLLEDEGRLKLDVDGVTFTGQCDRIDILSKHNGQSERVAFIVDYKLGSSSSYEKGLGELIYPTNSAKFRSDIALSCDIKYGLQLSAYAFMFSQDKRFNDISLVGVGFLGLGDGKMTGTFHVEQLNLKSDLSLTGRVVDSNASASKKDKKGEKNKAEMTEVDRNPVLQRQDEAKFAMQCAAALLKNGSFRPVYTGSCVKGKQDACNYCKLKGICRKDEFRRNTYDDLDFDSELDEDDSSIDFDYEF